MSEHTKGEWQVSGKLPYIVATTAPPYRLSGKTIISRGSETGGQDWPGISNEEREANARLIAAAPDLLAACEYLIRVIMRNEPRGGSISKEAVELAEAAIAKVKA